MIKLNALADVADFHEVGPAVTVEEWCEQAQEAMKDDERLQRFLKAREVEEKLEVSEGEQKMQVEEELAVPVDGGVVASQGEGVTSRWRGHNSGRGEADGPNQRGEIGGR